MVSQYFKVESFETALEEFFKQNDLEIVGVNELSDTKCLYTGNHEIIYSVNISYDADIRIVLVRWNPDIKRYQCSMIGDYHSLVVGF